MSSTAKLFISYCYFFPCFSSFLLLLFPFNDLDDADFNLAIYEMQSGPVRYDADGRR